MRRHSIHHRAHAELAYAKENIPPSWIDMKARRILEDRLRRSRQVRRAAKELRHGTLNRLHHCLARIARRHWLLRREGRNLLLPARRHLALHHPLKLRRRSRISLLVLRKLIIPRRMSVFTL